MLLSVKDLLKKLVQIPSVNPSFSSAGAAVTGEEKLTKFLRKFIQKTSCSWLQQKVAPGRENLVAVISGALPTSGLKPLLWEVHQDTVGVAGMRIEPFAAEEAEGRIWGRGACDVKGGMAAMLAAFARVDADRAALRRPLMLAMTVNEECGFSGVKALRRLWGTADEAAAEAKNLSGTLSLAQFRELRPASAVVAEPTSLDVVVAHKGSVRWRCHTHGRAAHTSNPELGVNAISAMVGIVQAIQQYQRDVLDRRAAHPLCGRPTVCVSTIQGGSGVNTVPDHAVIDIDCRLVPGQSPDEAYSELVEYIDVRRTQESNAARIEHEQPTTQSSGLVDENNRGLAEQIAATTGSLGLASRLVGVPYGTNAWALSELGIPTVVFGPGSIEQAHTEDEWIDIEQLEQAAEIYYRLAVG